MWRSFILLLLAPLTLSAQAASPVTAEAGQVWLQKLLGADQQSYQGTFVYERNGSFSSHAIWHGLGRDGRVRERILQLDGPAQEVLRVDGQLQCVGGVRFNQATPMPVIQRLQPVQLAEHYEVRVLGSSRVAGHAAMVLGLLPRDQYRYGVELHLDQQTGVLLKSLLLNEQGQLLERFQFTQFDSRAELNAPVLQPGADCLPVSVVPVPPAPRSAWQVQWLPPGFSLVGVEQSGDQALTQLSFSDGLAQFSVFIEPVPDVAVATVHSQVGPTLIVSRELQSPVGAMLVTLVGEVPLLAAERVTQSIGLAAQQVQR
jgi:sigma-E factor negative regulatory protein RseB